MDAPSFWWRPASWHARVLQPAAALYAAGATRRLRREGARARLPVVCVGNPTLGGAGKTPTALRLAALLAETGGRPAFLTRGYGGRLAGPVRVDPDRHPADDVGDEPLLLARAFPTVVARDRVAGAEAAGRTDASVIVMDDGFQNPSLAKDCALLVVDAGRGLGNGRVFPAGPLRAPLPAQLQLCDALLVIGTGTGAANAASAATACGIPVFVGRLVPDPAAVAALKGRSTLAFTGIGHPEKFFATLEEAGIAIPLRRAFADHHRYTEAEAMGLLAEAQAWDLDLVTTEKDLARMQGDPALALLREGTRSLPVSLALENETGLRDFVLRRLSART